MWNVVTVLLLVFAGILLEVCLGGLSSWVSSQTRLLGGWSFAPVLSMATLTGPGARFLAPKREVQSSVKALYVTRVYVVVQVAESYLIFPIRAVGGRRSSAGPTITLQVLVVVLFGLLGVLLATPLMAVILVLVKMLYIEDLLGEPAEVPGDEHE